MKIRTAAITDIGVKRKENQDAIYVNSFEQDGAIICLAAVCDGVGSYKDSRLASGYVVGELEHWFRGVEKEKIKDRSFSSLCNSLKLVLNLAHEMLIKGQKENELQMATTVTCTLIVDKEICCFNVGDSRTYLVHMKSKRVEQITQDDVVIEPGNRGYLAQAIGGKKSIYISQIEMKCEEKMVFIMASDGFYKRTRKGDLLAIARAMKYRKKGEKQLKMQVQRVKQMGEKDNISAVIVYLR